MGVSPTVVYRLTSRELGRSSSCHLSNSCVLVVLFMVILKIKRSSQRQSQCQVVDGYQTKHVEQYFTNVPQLFRVLYLPPNSSETKKLITTGGGAVGGCIPVRHLAGMRTQKSTQQKDARRRAVLLSRKRN
jgi:hypothetical protein